MVYYRALGMSYTHVFGAVEGIGIVCCAFRFFTHILFLVEVVLLTFQFEVFCMDFFRELGCVFFSV